MILDQNKVLCLWSTSGLCSDHFGIEDYYIQEGDRFRLNNDAIPSVFEAFPNHLKKYVKPKRKPPMDRSDIPAKKSQNSFIHCHIFSKC